MKATIIIPCRDEAATIAGVLEEVRQHFSGEIIVVDNGSSDATASIAVEAGARVVAEPLPGYGRACNAGVAAGSPDTELLVFMDGDGSDRPNDIPALLSAIESGADLALGVRRGPTVEAGSIAPAARFGNWLSGALIGLLWGRRLHDLSPLKAIRAEALRALDLREQTYGWTVEMLAKAAARRLDIREVEAGYRKRRGGESKVSGNVRASMHAGYRILRTIGSVRVHTTSSGSWGALCGAGLGLLLLAAFSWWLLVQAPASPRVLVAPWLVGWPLLFVLILAGYSAGRVLARGRLVNASVRSPSGHPPYDDPQIDGSATHPGR